MKFESFVRTATAAAAAVAFFSLAGCGSGLSTSAVSGKVVIEGGGDLKVLEGASVELMLESDPTVRASGDIKPDGSFELSTLYKGKIQNGAAEGAHSARIYLPDYTPPETDPDEDDDDGSPRPKVRFKPKAKLKKVEPPPIPEKYLNFNTSGWKVTVPTDGSVTLTITPEPKKK